MDTLWHDLRYAARTLARRPGLTLMAVLTLAVGIGGTTAIFTLVDAVLLRPLNYPHPARLVQLGRDFSGLVQFAVDRSKALFWQEHTRAFDAVAVVTAQGFNLAGGEMPERAAGELVSHEFFRVLGVPPALGRVFSPEEDRPGGPAVVVLSDGVWKRAFGADPRVLGRSALLNEKPHEIIGVMPPGFRSETAAGLWTPLRLAERTFDPGTNYAVTARLKPGVSLEQARADTARVFAMFREAHPEQLWKQETGVGVRPYREQVAGETRTPLLVLFGAAGFVLLIACANVANLLLVRAAARSREIAIRVALGAGRGRILGQLLSEGVLLALAGGAAGVALAVWIRDALISAAPASLPRAAEISLDARVLLFALGVSLLTGVFFGLVAVRQAGRVDLHQALKEGGERAAGGGRRLLPGAMVAGEVGLSVVLLAGAALLIATFVHLRGVGLGFDPENLMTASIPLGAQGEGTAARVWEFERRLLERVRAIPGVRSAATASSLPLERGLNHVVSLEGRPDDERHLIEYRAVAPEYFRTLGIALIRGREFTAHDASGAAPVVIVNERAARMLFPDGQALGGRFAVGKGMGPPLEEPMREVVGVVADIREVGLSQPAAPTIYVPRAQVPDGLAGQMNQWFYAALLVRTAGRVDIHRALREAVLGVDPQQPVAQVRWMTQVVAASIAEQRFMMLLMGGFGTVALLLTAVGLYGVVSYQVTRRTREIGVRMALGASAGGVLRMVLGHGLWLAGTGAAAGVAASLALNRLLAGLLFGVRAADPLVYAAVGVLLLGVTLAACWIPARRAARVDPVVALRYE